MAHRRGIVSKQREHVVALQVIEVVTSLLKLKLRPLQGFDLLEQQRSSWRCVASCSSPGLWIRRGSNQSGPTAKGRQNDRAEVHNGHVQISNGRSSVFGARNHCDPQVCLAQLVCLLLQLLKAGRLLLRTVGKSTGERIRSARVVLGDSEGQSHRVNPTLSPGPKPQVSCKKL